jgi:hypothetical protein
MATYTTTQQLQYVFTFPFQDPDWFKKLFFLCCLMPLVFSAFSMYLSLVSLTLFVEAYHDGVRKLEA